VSTKRVGVFMPGTVDKLELVNKFRYLGNMLGKYGDAEEASRKRVRCAWGIFNEPAPILNMRDL